MISGNCNRSPQCGAMGPDFQRHSKNQHPFAQQHHHQQPQLMFMAGGRVGGYPQMSRGFSMMPSGGPMRANVMQCNMQQSFGGGYSYSGNSGPIFQQRHHYNQPSHQQPMQPQMIHQIHQPSQQYTQQSYISSHPPINNTAPPSGLFSGIKDIVKGLIQPRNSDHHKYYNPKYRNNFMGNLGAEMSYTRHQPEPRIKTVVDLEVGMPAVNILERKSATAVNVPKPNEVAVPHKSPPKTTEVVAIFTSEDFPALPAPRRSRSITPAKTEKTNEQVPKVQKEAVKPKQPSPPSPSVEHTTTTPKSTYFEIKCTTTPCGRRPTFGGRLKIVPPPFSWNKSLRTCQTRCQESNTTKPEDCDTEDFVIFPKERTANCLFSSFGMCIPPRQRQISECSDDSFVVFFTEDADAGLVAIDSDDEDDDDEEDDDDSDSDVETSSEEEDDSDSESDEEKANGIDVVDSSFMGGNKTDRNKYAGTTPIYPEVVSIGAEQAQLDSGFDDKRVTFNLKPVVHVMHTWNFAYRAARKGHWEDYVRDRNRFQTRIERTSVYLNPILTPEHREKIYRTRFCDDADQLQQEQEQQQQKTNTKLET